MNRSTLAGLAVMAVAACQTESNVSPSDPLAPGISFQISDGSQGSGSPDLYFLPPMVSNPGVVPGTFNPNAHPTVSICLRNGSNTACVGSPSVFLDVGVSGQQYHLNWKSPKSAAANAIWRVSVLVGGIELGFADVKNAKNVDPNEFVSINAGQNLAIKFKIQTHCTQSSCGEGFVDPVTGGTVFFTVGGETIGGVIIPPGQDSPLTVTIQFCSSPANIQVDIPLFGSCLDVRVFDDDGEVIEGNELTGIGEVFVCNADDDADELSESQEGLVTLHREHGSQVQALPHSAGACPPVVGASFGGSVRALAHGHWKRAGRQFLGALSPQPLYARRRLNLGAGGKTCCFSNFQFALPSKMEINEGYSSRSGEWGTTHPDPLEVLVTDLLGEPVENATVHFAPTPGSGSVSAAAVLTGTDGIAAVNWTFPGETEQELKVEATGFGIASQQCDEGCTSIDGPRSEFFDPFMPIQDSFDECGDGCPPLTPTQLQTGKLTFNGFGFSCEDCSFAFLRAPTTIRPTDLIVGPLRGKASRPATRLPRVPPLPKSGKRVNH